MFILRDILLPLQLTFSNSLLGHVRRKWFVHVLMSCIIPFTNSMSSNLLRSLNHLFGMQEVKRRAFYVFMASGKLGWSKMWEKLWAMIPDPETDGRLLLALDDCTNPKVGKKVFGCSHVFDHAAKTNQSKYPWAQCFTAIGLLKQVKGRWTCIPLIHRFYLPKKALDAGCENMKVNGKVPAFQSKLAQAADMLHTLSKHFAGMPILAVCDSWFGNNGLFAPTRKLVGNTFHILSRLRRNIVLFDMPSVKVAGQLGRNRKYGARLGSAAELAEIMQEKAIITTVFLYGKKRELLIASVDVMLKNLHCPVRIVFVYRRTQWVALFSTDLSLSVTQMIEFYGARWKIESGFKEIKRDIGASSSQTRKAQSVMNHLNFCMMSVTITWLYALKLENTIDRRHIVRGRNSFAFSDVRHIIAKAVLTDGFDTVCTIKSKPTQNITITALLRMVA
ncbi:MAG: transposase [Ghiorsea sp.]|nr:transposase [Ghiorsea sp.]